MATFQIIIEDLGDNDAAGNVDIIIKRLAAPGEEHTPAAQLAAFIEKAIRLYVQSENSRLVEVEPCLH